MEKMKNKYQDIIEEYYRPLAEKFGLELVYLEQRDYRQGNPFLLVGKDFVLRFCTYDFVYIYYYTKEKDGNYHWREVGDLIALSCTDRERAKVIPNADGSRSIGKSLILHALTLENYWKSLLMGDRNWIAEFNRCPWHHEEDVTLDDEIEMLRPYLK